MAARFSLFANDAKEASCKIVRVTGFRLMNDDKLTKLREAQEFLDSLDYTIVSNELLRNLSDEIIKSKSQLKEAEEKLKIAVEALQKIERYELNLCAADLTFTRNREDSPTFCIAFDALKELESK